MTPRLEIPTEGPARDMAASIAALVPVLTTERLTLRAPRLDDFDDFARIVCTERGCFVGGPMSREDGWYDFANGVATWTLHGHGMWTVTETATDQRLGFVTLGLEPGDLEIELGYLFLESAEGQGFAREAALAARDWGFSALKLPTLVSYIDRDNTRSIRLVQAIGAVDDSPADWRPELVVYRHHAPEKPQ